MRVPPAEADSGILRGPGSAGEPALSEPEGRVEWEPVCGDLRLITRKKSADGRQKQFTRSFRINSLGENCSQAIDSIGSYTYPILRVGLSGRLSSQCRRIHSQTGTYQGAIFSSRPDAVRPETLHLLPHMADLTSGEFGMQGKSDKRKN